MMMPGTVTLDKVREWLKQRRAKGCRCPACNQFVKVWPRRLNKGMIYALRLMRDYDKENPGCFIHMSKWLAEKTSTNPTDLEYSKLLQWQLTEPKANTDPKKRQSGLWRITEKGKLFMQGNIAVPAIAFCFNKKVISYSEEQVHIYNVDTTFDYQELRGVRPEKQSTLLSE